MDFFAGSGLHRKVTNTYVLLKECRKSALHLENSQKDYEKAKCLSRCGRLLSKLS